jgi:uncharacterized protein
MSRFTEAFNKGLARALEGESGVSDSDRKKILTAIREAQQKEPPPTIVIVGETGVGKSSTINALFNAGEPVSAVTATTRSAVGMYVWTSAGEELLEGSRGLIRVFDMPGLGDDLRTHETYRKLYAHVLLRVFIVRIS